MEFALILIPLLLLVLGTIDWGYYFFLREVVANAAREGARAGSISHTAGDAEANTYLSGLGLDPVAQPCAAVAASCVQIDYPIPNDGSVTGFLAGVLPGAASAHATMRFE